MDFSLNITLDDDATEQDVANALEFATLHAAAVLRARKSASSLPVDGQIDLDLTKSKLQNATLNRYA